MRNAVLAFILLMIMMLTVVTINTVDATTTRQNELDSNLSAAMEQSMMLLTVEGDSSYSIETKEQLIADFIQNFLVKTTTDSSFEVKVLGADAEKGLLSVEVIETYGTYAGITKKVSASKTIILEDYVNEDNVFHKITFIVPDPTDGTKQTVVKQVSVHGGSDLEYAAPADPVFEGYDFEGWKCPDISNIAVFAELKGIHALGDYTFLAVFTEAAE